MAAAAQLPRSSNMRGCCSSSFRPYQSQCTQRLNTPLKATAAPSSPAWRVYGGRMPLIGLEAVAKVLAPTPAGKLLQLHTFLLLEGPPDQAGVWCFDFLPLNPTSPSTALQLLTAGNAPGEVRVKRWTVQQVRTSERLRLLGECSCQDALAAAHTYNRCYNKDLHLLLNNCMHYTNGLTRALLED